MSNLIDPIEAIRVHLLYGYPGKFDGLSNMRQWENKSLVSEVYQPRIPDEATRNLSPCLVMRRSGPGRGHLQTPLRYLNVDMRSIAPLSVNAPERWASDIDHAVYYHLRGLTRTVLPYPNLLAQAGYDEGGGVMVFWSRLVGGPLDVVDPDLDYPVVFSSYQFLIAEPQVG